MGTRIQRLILDMPFRKFAQRGFLRDDRRASRVRFAPALWDRLADQSVQARVRMLAEHAVSAYHARIDQGDPGTGAPDQPNGIRRAGLPGLS